MKNSLYKLILSITGQIQIYLLTAITFAVILNTYGYSQEFIVKTIVVSSLIRFLYFITATPKPVVQIISIRKKLKRLLEDETRMAISLAAFCLFTYWTILAEDLLVIVIVNYVIQFFGLLLTNRVLNYLKSKYLHENSDQKILIIGTGENAKHTADIILDAPETKSALSGFMDFHKKSFWRYRDIPMIGHPEQLSAIIANSQVDLIICALDNEDSQYIQSIFKTASEMGVPISLVPDLTTSPQVRVRPAYINALPMMLYHSVADNQFKLFTKSSIDKIGAMVGIILFAPFMFLIALAIKIEDRGPIFFRQVRSGINGKQFQLFKFRTMCVNAEEKKKELEQLNEMSGPVFKIKNDPRVTRVGSILRKTSMDELPQFFNVLLGDMSLVGPRPPLPKEVAQYEQWQHRRLSVKPGVTCTWQVSGRNNIDFEDWMKLDLEYIDKWSLWNDTKIIAKTIPAVMKGSGAS